MQNETIASMAFKAPPEPTYTSTDNIHYVYSRDGHRIATQFMNYSGKFDKYWDTDEYTDDRKFIIFSHGNADDIGGSRDYCKYLSETFDCNVITYDYVNYGLSGKGQSTESNMHSSLEAVYKYVRNTLKVPNEKIILMGKSLGTAPTVFLASRDFMDDILGVILVSPLASGARAIVPSQLVSSRMLTYLDSVFCPSIKMVPFIRVPVFIVHGKQDDIIPIENAQVLVQQLHQKAYYPPLYLHAKHNDVEMGNPILFRDQMIAFFNSCLARQDSEKDKRLLI